MLKKLYTTLKKLESFKEFKEFKHNNPDSYLSSCFFMIETKDYSKANWQLDFYSEANHKITSFIIQNDKLKIESNQDIFQKDKNILKELHIKKIKVDLNQILEKIDKINKKKYNEVANKIVVLLHNINDTITWNITYLTQSFKLWNLKFNALNGELISEKMENILSFKSQ